MTDLVAVLSTLVTPAGKILVHGIADLVEPLADGERARYEKINFAVTDIDAASESLRVPWSRQ